MSLPMPKQELKTIELPSGNKAEIVCGFNFREYLAIEAARMRAYKSHKTEAGEIKMELDQEMYIAAEIEAVALATKKIVVKDGTTIENPTKDDISALDPRDGIMLQAEIKEVENLLKKK